MSFGLVRTNDLTDSHFYVTRRGSTRKVPDLLDPDEDLDPYDLNNADYPSGVEVVSFSEGSRTMAREAVDSPFVDGDVALGTRANLQTAVITVSLYGSVEEIADLVRRVRILVNQFDFWLTVVVDGVTLGEWECGAADTEIGESGTWQSDELAAGFQIMTITIPRQPDFFAL